MKRTKEAKKLEDWKEGRIKTGRMEGWKRKDFGLWMSDVGLRITDHK